MRLTKKVFLDLGIFMIAFGLGIGIVFPFFVMLLGVSNEIALSPLFFFLCILAGLAVGAFNFFISKIVVGKRLRILAKHMNKVENKISDSMGSSIIQDCVNDECYIEVDSNDEIGESAHSFNELIMTLSGFMKTEKEVKEFNQILSTQIELEVLARKAVDKLLEHMNSDAGCLIIEQNGELVPVSSRGIKNPEKLINNDLITESYYKNLSKTIHLPKEIKIDGLLLEFVPNEIRIEPISYKNVSLGIVVLAFKESFNSNLKTNLELHLNTLSLALRNSITYNQLQTLAAFDQLTGLYNRHFGLNRLVEEYKRSSRTGEPLGVLMFDIDHFKSINDTYGHTVGDKVLRNIAKFIRIGLREGDFVIRYGGEEFVIVLPGASKEDSKDVAERIRRIIQESVTQHGKQVIKFTVSIGCTSYPQYDAKDENELIKIADEALYEAKESGRNKVVQK